MSDERYKVVIGMAVTKQDGNVEFADYGIVYSNMHYDQMVQVEAAFAKHADEINDGMRPLIADMVQMGMDEIPKRMGPTEKPTTPGGGQGR